MTLHIRSFVVAAVGISSFSAAAVFAPPAAAAPVHWTPGVPARAKITGGPWVLAEGTVADPLAGFPTPNAGTALFLPYYHAFTTGTDRDLQGYFDYRVKDTAEAIVTARSSDSGKTWTFQSKVLAFASPSLTDAGAANDDGEGHPFVLRVGARTLLYTLDRSAASVDQLGLLVREVAPSSQDPLAGAPANAETGSTVVKRTVGLQNPDGIIGLVPGTSSPISLLYLAKVVGTPSTTTVHVVDTIDGVTFTNDRAASGLTDAVTTFIGPRGSIVRFANGTYGLFYSAGLAGEDADAFHFIGYAETSDLVSWTVVNGVDHPLLSTDAAKDPSGGQPWYAGRVYAPSVTLSADGCLGTMMVSGYKTTKAKSALNDYRQIGQVALTRSCGAPDAGADDAGPLADASSGENGGGIDASSDGGSSGGNGAGADGGNVVGAGNSGACSHASARGAGPTSGFAIVAALFALVAKRRRRDAR